MRPEAVERERAFHTTEIGRLPALHETALVRMLARMVSERDALIADVKADLRGGRRAPWEQKRDALARIREWEAS